MTKTENKKRLVLPALRAKMGKWIYYVTFMKMIDIAERIDCAKSFYSSKTLEELLQRQIVEGRARDISTYLIKQKQRFFNSLVIGTYGGDPQWQEIAVRKTTETAETIPTDLEGTIGFLFLDGSEKLFPIDGQHRVEGIRLAVKGDAALKTEEVGVILVRGITAEMRREDEEGFERTRRLFTTLNRYAKPVNKKDIIALDEDDATAIITRRLVEEYSLFSGEKTSLKDTQNISSADKKSLISIQALYDAVNAYLIKGPNRSWNEFKKFYPGEEKIEELYQITIKLWDEFCKFFSPLNEIKEGKKTAEKYRTIEGGHILFRPIGLLMYVKIIRQLMDLNKLTLEQAIERLSKVPTELSSEPWAFLLWNTNNKRILTASPNRKAAEKLLFYSVGGDLTKVKSDPNKLRKAIADIRDIEETEITLPIYAGN